MNYFNKKTLLITGGTGSFGSALLEKFSIENLTTKRPGNGICPMKWNDIIGEKAIKNYEIDDMI